MIEIRAAPWTADQIAEDAEFFSFGTNDLTQMTFGYCRDDAEGGFLLKYVDAASCLRTRSRRWTTASSAARAHRGRKGRADPPGPQGRHLRRARRRPRVDPQCEKVGLDYVSCSPFRVPVARLAAAQAALVRVTERDK